MNAFEDTEPVDDPERPARRRRVVRRGLLLLALMAVLLPMRIEVTNKPWFKSIRIEEGPLVVYASYLAGNPSTLHLDSLLYLR